MLNMVMKITKDKKKFEKHIKDQEREAEKIGRENYNLDEVDLIYFPPDMKRPLPKNKK